MILAPYWVYNNKYVVFVATLGKGQSAFKFFSAACYLYGRHIYETLGYPIGLIATDWGGTPVEAWSSPDALKQCGINGTETK